MSWLFPLPISGRNTPHVEALSSYLLRLARIHTAASGTFISMVVERYCWPNAPRRTGILSSSLSALIRPNDSTLLVLEALAFGLSIAVSELEQTTFLALGGALNRPQKAFSPRVRWCPACLSDQVADGGDAYFELVWQVLVVETCDVHGVRLRDRCNSCGGGQDGYQARQSLAECIHCGARLDKLKASDICLDSYGKDIRLLVGHIATNPGTRFPMHGVSAILRGLLDEAWTQGNEASLYRMVPRDECIRFCDPDEPLTLISALRIAFWLGIPLVDLLLGRLQGTNRSVLEGAKEALPAMIAPRHRRRIGSVERLAIEMARIVETANEPLPLKGVARQLGVSVGALQYHLPNQSEEITRAYLLSRQQRRASISTQCRSSVQKAMVRWARVENCPFSKKGLLFALRANTGLPKNVLREEIKRQTASSHADVATGGAK